MGNYPIGRLIAEMRGRRGLSQEELSSGICAVSTLSRIENGVQMPSRRVYMALLERLGLSHRSCRIYVSDVDMRRSVLEERIAHLTRKRQYEKAYLALAEYLVCDMERTEKEDSLTLLEDYAKKLGVENAGDAGGFSLAEHILLHLAEEKGASGTLSALELQYALLALGILVEEGEHCGERAYALYRCALLLTMPELSPESLEQVRFFSREELRLLTRIAVLCYGKGEQVRAKKILFVLRDYLETEWMDPEERAESYPEILYDLSLWMGNDGRVERQLEFCDQGIALCLQSGRLQMLPQLLEVKGCALAADGQCGQAGPILKQAHLILQMVGESAKAEDLREKARNLFQIELLAV